MKYDVRMAVLLSGLEVSHAIIWWFVTHFSDQKSNEVTSVCELINGGNVVSQNFGCPCTIKVSFGYRLRVNPTDNCIIICGCPAALLVVPGKRTVISHSRSNCCQWVIVMKLFCGCNYNVHNNMYILYTKHQCSTLLLNHSFDIAALKVCS